MKGNAHSSPMTKKTNSIKNQNNVHFSQTPNNYCMGINKNCPKHSEGAVPFLVSFPFPKIYTL
jgi:hypothetical protein